MTNSAHDAAVGLIEALDRNDADDLEQRFDPGATWWVDTGFDRAAGAFVQERDDRERPWPLHGAVDARAKCRRLRRLPEVFPSGCRQQVTRSFAGGSLALLEVAGDGLFRGVTPYRNHYAFVVEVAADGAVVGLREYLDTEHAAAVFGDERLQRRTTAPWASPPAAVPSTAAGTVVADFVSTIAAADGDRMAALCRPDATWWADGGRRRTAGPDGPVGDAGNPTKGRVAVSTRAALITAFGDELPDGYEMVVHRLVEADDAGDSGLVAAEVVGNGRHRTGVRYQNRYCFVVEVVDGWIADVREYCDTRHGFDVLSGRAGRALPDE